MVANMLTSKKILLGISGGIAAYKACELVRRLRDRGASVRVVMTEAACQFITPLTFQALSGNPVHTSLFDLNQEAQMSHITLADESDLILVAPASADLLAKMTHGICNDLLTTLLCATLKPVFICPSMNVNMWNHPATQSNISVLKSRGIHLINPDSGSLACGWKGMGRLAEAVKILEALNQHFKPSPLKSHKIVITAGPTWEPLDPVRHLSNPASGKTGYALAQKAKERGAEVVLISGPTHLESPPGVHTVRIQTADQMASATHQHFQNATVAICTAAVSDFRPKHVFSQKTKKNQMPSIIELEPNEDILLGLGKKKTSHQILVGFAAETENVAEEAHRKLKSKNLDLICANDVSREALGFATNENQLNLYWRDGRSNSLPVLQKNEIADKILDEIEILLKK